MRQDQQQVRGDRDRGGRLVEGQEKGQQEGGGPGLHLAPEAAGQAITCYTNGYYIDGADETQSVAAVAGHSEHRDVEPGQQRGLIEPYVAVEDLPCQQVLGGRERQGLFGP